MMWENIAIQVTWNSISYRRVFSLQLMTVHGGHDNKLVTEGGEQLFLGYLSPG